MLKAVSTPVAVHYISDSWQQVLTLWKIIYSFLLSCLISTSKVQIKHFFCPVQLDFSLHVLQVSFSASYLKFLLQILQFQLLQIIISVHR